MELITSCIICGSNQLNPYLSCKDSFLSGEIFKIQQCKGCGFIFTNPRPLPADLGKYYQSSEYISHSNAKKGVFNQVYQQIRKYTLSQKFNLIGKYAKGNHILDVGCATGEFLNYMKSRGWKTTGVEPDEQVRQKAKETYHLDVFDESQVSIMKDDSFDVITLWHVLEHVADLPGRMKELNRLLKPGGILIIAVPNSNSPDAAFYKENWAAYDVPRHLYHFSEKSMKMLLEKFSFSSIEILPMKFDSYYVSLLSEKYIHGNMRWIHGFWNGFCSNWKARKKRNHSSLIFVSKKK
ncbi:MAG: class I SAM-dependent methyltransferase [Bacteroidales bacterium]|nr:class I SAM-dependent methyltransferase [Bacteroidales bacterium]